jgi:phage-related protein
MSGTYKGFWSPTQTYLPGDIVEYYSLTVNPPNPVTKSRYKLNEYSLAGGASAPEGTASLISSATYDSLPNYDSDNPGLVDKSDYESSSSVGPVPSDPGAGAPSCPLENFSYPVLSQGGSLKSPSSYSPTDGDLLIFLSQQDLYARSDAGWLDYAYFKEGLWAGPNGTTLTLNSPHWEVYDSENPNWNNPTAYDVSGQKFESTSLSTLSEGKYGDPVADKSVDFDEVQGETDSDAYYLSTIQNYSGNFNRTNSYQKFDIVRDQYSHLFYYARRAVTPHSTDTGDGIDPATLLAYDSGANYAGAAQVSFNGDAWQKQGAQDAPNHSDPGTVGAEWRNVSAGSFEGISFANVVIRPPTDYAYSESHVGTIESKGSGALDFTEYYKVGDLLDFSNSSLSKAVNKKKFNIIGVGPELIWLGSFESATEASLMEVEAYKADGTLDTIVSLAGVERYSADIKAYGSCSVVGHNDRESCEEANGTWTEHNDSIWSHDKFFFDADYGSKVIFKAKNKQTQYGEGYTSVSPLGINSLGIGFDLRFTNRSNREANAIIHFLENQLGQHETDEKSYYLDYDQGISGFFLDGDTLFFPYNNPENLSRRFYCFDYEHTIEDEDVNSVNAKIMHSNSSTLNVAEQIFVNKAPVWHAEKTYNLHDVVFCPDNYQYYYSRSPDPHSTFRPWVKNSGSSGVTSINKDKWSREFYWSPSLDFGVSHSPAIDEVVSDASPYTQYHTATKQNVTLLNISLSFKNRSDEEAYAILHFLESHLGYKSFLFVPPAPYNRKRRFYCESWEHTYVFRNNHTITASFAQYPLGQNTPLDDDEIDSIGSSVSKLSGEMSLQETVGFRVYLSPADIDVDTNFTAKQALLISNTGETDIEIGALVPPANVTWRLKTNPAQTKTQAQYDALPDDASGGATDHKGLYEAAFTTSAWGEYKDTVLLDFGGGDKTYALQSPTLRNLGDNNSLIFRELTAPWQLITNPAQTKTQAQYDALPDDDSGGATDHKGLYTEGELVNDHSYVQTALGQIYKIGDPWQLIANPAQTKTQAEYDALLDDDKKLYSGTEALPILNVTVPSVIETPSPSILKPGEEAVIEAYFETTGQVTTAVPYKEAESSFSIPYYYAPTNEPKWAAVPAYGATTNYADGDKVSFVEKAWKKTGAQNGDVHDSPGTWKLITEVAQTKTQAEYDLLSDDPWQLIADSDQTKTQAEYNALPEDDRTLYSAADHKGLYESDWLNVITYSKGNIVQQEDKVYRLTEETSAAAAFNSAHWERVLKTKKVNLNAVINPSLVDDKKKKISIDIEARSLGVALSPSYSIHDNVDNIFQVHQAEGSLSSYKDIQWNVSEEGSSLAAPGDISEFEEITKINTSLEGYLYLGIEIDGADAYKNVYTGAPETIPFAKSFATNDQEREAGGTRLAIKPNKVGDKFQFAVLLDNSEKAVGHVRKTLSDDTKSHKNLAEVLSSSREIGEFDLEEIKDIEFVLWGVFLGNNTNIPVIDVGMGYHEETTISIKLGKRFPWVLKGNYRLKDAVREAIILGGPGSNDAFEFIDEQAFLELSLAVQADYDLLPDSPAPQVNHEEYSELSVTEKEYYESEATLPCYIIGKGGRGGNGMQTEGVVKEAGEPVAASEEMALPEDGEKGGDAIHIPEHPQNVTIEIVDGGIYAGGGGGGGGGYHNDVKRIKTSSFLNIAGGGGGGAGNGMGGAPMGGRGAIEGTAVANPGEAINNNPAKYTKLTNGGKGGTFGEPGETIAEDLLKKYRILGEPGEAGRAITWNADVHVPTVRADGAELDFNSSSTNGFTNPYILGKSKQIAPEGL